MPNFQHDCPDCKFLISNQIGNKLADWYFCERAESDMGGSLISRFSSKDYDYWSLPLDVIKGSSNGSLVLQEAKKIIENFERA